MVDPRPDPDWDLLPEDPVAFFGLSPGYDRTALRRAYTRLIRRFKPERHPDEFQRIRQAYEALDSRPESAAFDLVPGFRFEAEEEESELDVPDSEGSWTEAREEEFELRPAVAEFARRLAESSPDELHRELVRQEKKAPFDHYALAVLTDAVEPDRPAGFAARLVDGLAHHPDAVALREVLLTYLWQPLGESEGVAALRAAVALEPEEFLALTEPLWIRLGNVMSFPAWRLLLDEAKADMERAPISCRAHFDLQLTRAMVFRADADWLEALMSRLAEHETDIPSMDHDTLDQLEMLVRYRRSRDELLAAHPFRRRVDHALQTWVEEDAAEAQRVFLDLQQEILIAPERTLEAFPPEESDMEAMMSLYMTVAADLAPQLGTSSELLFEDEIESELVEEPLRFLDKLDTRTVRSPLGRRWSRRLAMHVVGLGLACVMTVGTVAYGSIQLGRAAGVGSGLGLVLLIGVICALTILIWVMVKSAARRRRRYSEGMRRRAHADLWRDAVVGFQVEANLTHWQLIHATRYGNKSRWPFVIHLRDMLENDHGLALFGLALKFQG